MKNYMSLGMLFNRYLIIFFCVASYFLGTNQSNIKSLSKRLLVSGVSLLNDVEVECPGNEAIVIGYFGQSNSTNNVRPASHMSFSRNLLQFDWRNSKCYKYNEPLIAVAGRSGNSITYFANSLAANVNIPVLIIPFGIPGSSVHEWSYGSISYYYQAVLLYTKENNIDIDLFMWHQGESDSQHPSASLSNFKDFNPAIGVTGKKFLFGTRQRHYSQALLEIIRISRSYFPESYFGIAIASKCGENHQWKPVQKAQAKVAEMVPKVFLTAHSDQISGNKYRYDGCHFSQRGAEELSNQYTRSVSAIEYFNNFFKH